jgi:hypothetical protein
VTRLLEAVSYGGGVNSTALIVLLTQPESDWHGPIVFADTGCEWPETYCYMTYFENEYLRPRGLSITRLQGLPWQAGRASLPLVTYCQKHGMVPLMSARWCTKDWKGKPIDRWAAANGIERQLLGIDAGEDYRRPAAYRPLVEAGIDRAGCVQLIEAMGLNVPQKSGCYICPFARISQRRRLWELHPDLFEVAAQLEEGASRRTGRRITLDPSGEVSLRQMEARFKAQLPMFDVPTMDDLIEYPPCECGL